MFISSAILIYDFLKDEIKAIGVVKRYIKENYVIDESQLDYAFIVKADGAWDIEIRIPKCDILFLVEVSTRTWKEIERKIERVKDQLDYILSEATRNKDYEVLYLKYKKAIWIHVNSKTQKINAVAEIPLPKCY